MAAKVSEDVHVGMTGERGVGKTSLGLMYLRGSFPVSLPMTAPMVERDELKTVTVDGIECTTQIHDTEGGGQALQEEYHRLRPLGYYGTHVMLLCFSVDKKDSLEKISSVYLPEVQHHCPLVPVLLVACKIDLRGTCEEETIQSHEGAAMARGLGCGYWETSAIENTGVEECFIAAVKEGLRCKYLVRGNRYRRCQIL